MQSLRNLIQGCSKCERLHHDKQVLGEGDHKASIFIVGEAPGEEEYKTGMPFVGASGKILRNALATADIAPKHYYITNTLKCHPPENSNPEPEETENCSQFLMNTGTVI